MWAMLKEVFFYFAFLMLISFIAWGLKDQQLFHMTQLINDGVSGGSMKSMKENVGDVSEKIF